MTVYTGPKIVTQEGDHKIFKSLIATITATAGVFTLGQLPAGANVRRVTVGIRTGFNGTLPTLNVGHASSTGAYMSTSKITSISAAGVDTYLPGVTVGSSAISAIVTLTNASGSAGAATVILEYDS